MPRYGMVVDLQKCVGCGSCTIACKTDESHMDKNELIKGCTASGSEVADKAGAIPPHRNAYRYPGYKDVRKDGMIEKCTFCIHRVKKGEEPYCVVSCPANARTFGDLDDKNSEISKTLKKHKSSRLKNNKGDLLKDGERGTQPNVSYIRSFKPEVRKT
ncbi:MAG: 4Fe-4S binding protein [Thermodesulfobacteriota bacterium]|nr:4Fe-4S binding protein [Thermodesulfobacteriota bacterium]